MKKLLMLVVFLMLLGQGVSLAETDLEAFDLIKEEKIDTYETWYEWRCRASGKIVYGEHMNLKDTTRYRLEGGSWSSWQEAEFDELSMLGYGGMPENEHEFVKGLCSSSAEKAGKESPVEQLINKANSYSFSSRSEADSRLPKGHFYYSARMWQEGNDTCELQYRRKNIYKNPELGKYFSKVIYYEIDLSKAQDTKYYLTPGKKLHPNAWYVTIEDEAMFNKVTYKFNLRVRNKPEEGHEGTLNKEIDKLYFSSKQEGQDFINSFNKAVKACSE